MYPSGNRRRGLPACICVTALKRAVCRDSADCSVRRDRYRCPWLGVRFSGAGDDQGADWFAVGVVEVDETHGEYHHFVSCAQDRKMERFAVRSCSTVHYPVESGAMGVGIRLARSARRTVRSSRRRRTRKVVRHLDSRRYLSEPVDRDYGRFSLDRSDALRPAARFGCHGSTFESSVVRRCLRT